MPAFPVASLAAAVVSFAAGLPGFLSASDGGVRAAVASRPQSQTDASRQTLAEKVEREYVVGPQAAGDLGFRVMWQARMRTPAGTFVRRFAVDGPVLLAIDGHNGVARLRPSDGAQMWLVAVASPVDIYRGGAVIETPVNVDGRITLEQRIYICTDTECFVLDGNSGSLIARQPFAKLPSTPPVVAGNFFVYGTLAGQLVWHQYLVGHEFRANTLKGRIKARPISADGRIFAVSEGGSVMSLDADSARRVWERSTFGANVANPAYGAGGLFVASADQYLWAFDARTGATLWRYFTQSPLLTGPAVWNDAVLQYIPGEGLVCFAADAGGRLDGVVRWRNESVSGAPVGNIDDKIALWDEDTRVLTLIDPKRGAAVSTHHLPQCAELLFVRTGQFAGDLFATSDDGRVVRLTPRNPRQAPAPVPAEKRKAPEPIPPSIPDPDSESDSD